MWPFSKRSEKSQAGVENDERWSVVVAEDDDGPVVVRCSQSAGNRASAGFSIRLGFAIPLNHPNEKGMPSAAENAELLLVEDLIARSVSASAQGVHALTLTPGLMKEMVFYIAPGADIAKLHQAIQAQVSSHEVQCMAVEDPQWEVYRAYAY